MFTMTEMRILMRFMRRLNLATWASYRALGFPGGATWARYWALGFPGGATWTPRKPARSMACRTNPEALASSMNSLR